MNQGISAYEITGAPKETNSEINESLFSHIDFGPLKAYLEDDNITDISYSNNGQVWLKSLDKGVYRVDNPGIDNELMEKIAFQCANIMGKVFNMASPFLDSESSELRMNFVHDSVARNGIAAVFRKTPAKIRLKKDKIIADKYITVGIHDFLIDCVKGHCNIIVCGETGSGKTELVKYLASHTAENEKIVTIEDTLELHLDRIYPNRDIVAMKTNNIASYSDVLVTCMRQNPKWILLSEVRSAEAVTAVRNSISSGHNILSTIHADKAQSIPYRLYSLLESNIDVEQFMTTIYRYIQIGIHVRARYDKKNGGFMREVSEVCEFHVTKDNVPEAHTIYRKNIDGTEVMNEPSEYLLDYLEAQGVDIRGKEYTKEFESSADAPTHDDMFKDAEVHEETKGNDEVKFVEEPAVSNNENVPTTEKEDDYLVQLPEQNTIETPVVENKVSVDTVAESQPVDVNMSVPALDTPSVDSPIVENTVSVDTMNESQPIVSAPVVAPTVDSVVTPEINVIPSVSEPVVGPAPVISSPFSSIDSSMDSSLSTTLNNGINMNMGMDEVNFTAPPVATPIVPSMPEVNLDNNIATTQSSEVIYNNGQTFPEMVNSVVPPMSSNDNIVNPAITDNFSTNVSGLDTVAAPTLGPANDMPLNPLGPSPSDISGYNVPQQEFHPSNENEEVI